MNNGKPEVLIIDDEKGLRLGTQRLLESEGYAVEAAENGTEGIKLGKNKDFDLAVIDLKMPDIDGLEVLKEIKKHRPHTVCFIATAFASYDTAIEATRIGAYSYIPKPFTPEELLHQLEKGYNQRVLMLEAEKLRKEREERLLELASEKSRLRTIINSITGGVIVVNKTGELVYYNDASIKNLDLDSLRIGEKVLAHLPAKITEMINKYLDSDKHIRKSYSIQLEIKPDNELFVEAVCSPVVNPDGSLAGVVLVIRNITELKRIELIKSQFVSMVAHELKTPVAAVQGFLKLMMDPNIDLPPEKQNDYLSRSVNRLQGLLEMVNDLLDISRMELKTKQREIEVLDMKEVLASTIEFLSFEYEKRGITINTDIQDKEAPFKADKNELTRLFTNILSNAIKYNKENGSINISLYEKNNYVVTEISDSGIGMKPEEKARLFNEFFRAKNENTRGIAGTGLGLSIVKRIVDSYHGKIDVDTEYGSGTTFKVYLPKLNK